MDETLKNLFAAIIDETKENPKFAAKIASVLEGQGGQKLTDYELGVMAGLRAMRAKNTS